MLLGSDERNEHYIWSPSNIRQQNPPFPDFALLRTKEASVPCKVREHSAWRLQLISAIPSRNVAVDEEGAQSSRV